MLNVLHDAIASDSKRKLRKASAYNRDLREQIHRDTFRAIEQTKPVAERFRGAGITDSCRNIHQFLRSNIIYLRDSGARQEIQLPSSLLRRLTGDCKSYSVFCFAILENLYPGNPRYKFASYPDELGNGSKIPSHIYVEAADESRNPICLDGTNPHFNIEKPPFHSFTTNPMTVYTISGDVLADEVLADEVLASDAAERFAKRLKMMDKSKRKRYLQQFSEPNRKKLLRSVKSHLKLSKLQKPVGEMNVFDWEDDSGEMIEGNRSVNDEVLAGKKAKQRRAARKEKKAAKAKPGSNKAKRLATKAKILKAKATGDKTALKAARKERNERIKQNAKKIGKVIAKINPVLGVGRGAFLGLVSLNVRGLATNISNISNKSELKKKWEAIGGKWSRLEKAVAKGKGKKALLGKKKISDEVLAEAIYGIYGIGDGGASAIAVTAAAPVLAALVPVIMKLLKGEGKEPTEDLNGDGIINDLDQPAAKNKFSAFVDKVQDFIEERPVLNAAYEAGSEKVAETLEAIGVKGSAPSEAEEEENNPEETGTPGWKIAGVAALVIGGGYLLTRKKAA